MPPLVGEAGGAPAPEEDAGKSGWRGRRWAPRELTRSPTPRIGRTSGVLDGRGLRRVVRGNRACYGAPGTHRRRAVLARPGVFAMRRRVPSSRAAWLALA